MSNFLREGDKGLVVEVFYKTITASIGPGTLSKQMWVRFINDETGQMMTARRQDLTKDNT